MNVLFDNINLIFLYWLRINELIGVFEGCYNPIYKKDWGRTTLISQNTIEIHKYQIHYIPIYDCKKYSWQ